ncbi:MAG: exosortase [Moraxellaceae bacterium]|jgi:exosortase/archaeosortase family protein|nr:exosortase [Moraxellaceae bacterium]
MSSFVTTLRDFTGQAWRRLQALPAAVCLAALLAALWPVWVWSLARMRDGSDEPLGVVALAALLVALAWQRAAWGRTLASRWALLTVILAAVACLGAGLPMLLRAVAASLAVSALLAGMARRGQPLLPYAGLALLSLPLLSSLQFYAGFPLRVVTAEASLWLLRAAGFVTERSGASLIVDGRLVLVDAPCSGIHMAWTAYFIACVAALLAGLRDRDFLRRAPLIGLLVVSGNVLRNTVLVAREGAGWDWPAWAHAGVGLLVLVAVCLGVFHLMGRAVRSSAVLERAMEAGAVPATSADTARAKPWLLVALALFAVAPLQARTSVDAQAAPPAPANWPETWEGRRLQPLSLSAVEQRFAAQFPGIIGRFSDGERLVVLRRITAPTRMLHPAADCYRGLGYVIRDERLERESTSRLRRCFIAERNGRRLRVCERISDAANGNFTDASAWFWAASLGRSPGPWLAVTTAQVL